MGNDLATVQPATASSTLVSTANARAMLSRAFDVTATFTAAEIALAEQIAAIVPTPLPADADYIRRSIGPLAASMPAQATGAESGSLKLKTYQTMLAGCDERAIAYACRRCLDELDWMPTVHQLKERIAQWVSPEQAAIAQARAIVRAGRRAPADDDAQPVRIEDMAALRGQAERAAVTLARPKPQPVSFADAALLEPHQIRIPNKGDYERLFGIDPAAEKAKAERLREQDEERDRDLLLTAYEQQAAMSRAA